MTQSNGIHCILDERATPAWNDDAIGQRPDGVTLCGRKVPVTLDGRGYDGAWSLGHSFSCRSGGSWHRPCRRCAAVVAKAFADAQ